MPLPSKKPSKLGFDPSRPPFELTQAGEANPYYKFLFYSDSKVGKTHLAGTSQQVEGMAPVLACGFGNGLDTLIGEPDFVGLSTLKIRSLQEVNDIYNWLRPDWDNDGTGGNAVQNYRTVILDELDRMYDLLMRERMIEVVREKPERNPDKPALDDYGVVRWQFLRIVDWFLALPAHIIMTAWVERNTDPNTNRQMLTPSLPGKLASELPGRFGILSFMEYNLPRRRPQTPNDDPNGVRLAHFSASSNFVAGVWGKSRSERLGTEMENPTMYRIYNLLEGN